jgi:hypothetical protein
MSRISAVVFIAAFGLTVGSVEAQNAKKEHQTDARVKKCQSLTGAERDACLQQARKQPDPNGSTGENQGAKSDNTASPQQVQPGQPGAQSGAKKTDPSTAGTSGHGQQQQ